LGAALWYVWGMDPYWPLILGLLLIYAAWRGVVMVKKKRYAFAIPVFFVCAVLIYEIVLLLAK